MARVLGKEGYGELGFIRSTIDMFILFACFGLGLTAAKHVAEFRRTAPQRAGRLIGLSGLTAAGTGGAMAVLLLIFAPWVAQWALASPSPAKPSLTVPSRAVSAEQVPADRAHSPAEGGLTVPSLTAALRIGTFAMLFSAMNGAQIGAMVGLEAFQTMAHVNVLIALASFPVLLTGALWGGVEGALWASVLMAALGWSLNHWACARGRRAGVPFYGYGGLEECASCGNSAFPRCWGVSLRCRATGAAT